MASGSRLLKFALRATALFVTCIVGCHSAAPVPGARSPGLASTADPTGTAARSGTPQVRPPAEPPAPRYAVKTIDFDWTDDARHRDVPARLYLPVLPDSPKSDVPSRVPLIVFSHGLGGSRNSYSNLGRYWAQYGIAALHVQHVGSDRAIWASRGLALYSALRSAATVDEAIARVHDVSFALDRLLAEPDVTGRIDVNRLGVAGHSFGANTALLAAGAKFMLDGREVTFGDKRFKAALIMSPPSLPSDQDANNVYGVIRIPTMHLTGSRDSTLIPGVVTLPWQRREPYDAILAKPKYLGIFEDGTHNMFSDWTRGDLETAIKESTQQITLAFWRAEFDHDATSIAELAQAPDVAATLTKWEAR